MQHLSPCPRRENPVSRAVTGCQTQVRFFALVELNHILHRLCGPPSIPLSFSLATVLPRRDAYCVSSGTEFVNEPHTKHPSFTAWTTRVSNPVCSPRFRASASVSFQKAAFATDFPPDIYGFHSYTGNSAFLSRTQATQFPVHFRG